MKLPAAPHGGISILNRRSRYCKICALRLVADPSSVAGYCGGRANQNRYGSGALRDIQPEFAKAAGFVFPDKPFTSDRFHDIQNRRLKRKSIYIGKGGNNGL